MSNAASIKDKLHQYIDVADEQKLQAIYILLEDEIEQRYTATEMEQFHERRKNHQQGISASYTVEESFNLVRQQKK